MLNRGSFFIFSVLLVLFANVMLSTATQAKSWLESSGDLLDSLLDSVGMDSLMGDL